MRQIIVDTETTGLNPAEGHRIIEIAAVELIDRKLTGRHYHHYINPQRTIDSEAQAIHGLTADFLADKSLFATIADELLAFIADAELVIHNAPFDVGFLNSELQRLTPAPPLIEQQCKVLDTLVLARKKHPGQQNSLDALCRRYSVDNSKRELHGALLDTHLLAAVYLAMTGGQTQLFAEETPTRGTLTVAQLGSEYLSDRTPLKIILADAEEIKAHENRLAAIAKANAGVCIWQTD